VLIELDFDLIILIELNYSLSSEEIRSWIENVYGSYSHPPSPFFCNRRYYYENNKLIYDARKTSLEK
jgi:hypothetical protein